MTMITCLILWIPCGTTYMPNWPPTTCSGSTGSPGALHAASEPATSRAATALAARTRTRLAPIHQPFPNAGNRDICTERAYRHDVNVPGKLSETGSPLGSTRRRIPGTRDERRHPAAPALRDRCRRPADLALTAGARGPSDAAQALLRPDSRPTESLVPARCQVDCGQRGDGPGHGVLLGHGEDRPLGLGGEARGGR